MTNARDGAKQKTNYEGGEGGGVATGGRGRGVLEYESEDRESGEDSEDSSDEGAEEGERDGEVIIEHVRYTHTHIMLVFTHSCNKCILCLR